MKPIFEVLSKCDLMKEQLVCLSVEVRPAIDFMKEAATVDLCKNDLD